MAKKFVKDLDFKMPVVVDSINNNFEEKYSSWPERFYIIEDSKFSYIARPNGEGYSRADIRNYLINYKLNNLNKIE